MNVLICSGTPDRLNTNAVLRDYVGRGFAEVIPHGRVMTSSFDYAVGAAARMEPDLIVVFGSCMLPGCDFSGLKTYCLRSGAVLVFWLHDDPYEFDFNDKIYPYADFIFSNDRWAAAHIDHPRVFHLPLAGDRSAHFRPVADQMDRDVFFCGVGFANRVQLLTDCAKALAPFGVEIFGAEWPNHLPFCANKRLPNTALPDHYAASLVTLNIGRRHNLANSKYHLDATTPGPRTFEAAMAGAVQCVYVEGMELADYFDFGEEILVFDSAAELRRILEELRAAPPRRRSIAEKAQARALRDHTYARRAATLLQTCGFSAIEAMEASS